MDEMEDEKRLSYQSEHHEQFKGLQTRGVANFRSKQGFFFSFFFSIDRLLSATALC